MHMYIMPMVPRISMIMDMAISVNEKTSSSMAIAALICNKQRLSMASSDRTSFSYLVYLLSDLNRSVNAIGVGVRQARSSQVKFCGRS